MKAVWLTLLLLTAAVITVSAETIDTINFEIDKLRIDDLKKTVGYDSFNLITDEGKPAVPVGRFIYHTEQAVDVQIRCSVTIADTIDLGFQPAICIADQPTSDRNYKVEQSTILYGSKRTFPAQPYLPAVSKTKSQTIISLSVFPVQFSDNSRIIFNRQVVVLYKGAGNSFAVKSGMPPFVQAKAVPSPSIPWTNNGGCPLDCELVIITSPALTDAYVPMINLKLQTGFNAAIAITDSIYAHYSGVDEAAAIRNYLKDFYQAGGRYVILGGDEDNVPVRYAYYYNTDVSPELKRLMICDLYFADLDGDWNFDGDDIWGEPTQDHPDLGAELAVGRLPFSDTSQIAAYTAKIEDYLFSPGGGDPSYLNRSIFFTSDQMRDYFEGGQQYHVAEKFPDHMSTDCETLAETPSGKDPAPVGPTAPGTMSALADGYGMINILAHGRPDGFIINSSEYNLCPKTYILTGTDHTGDAEFVGISRNRKTGLYYSISCEQGAIDLESLYSMQVPSVVEELLALDSAGAVGMVAFSRWGWVASSYKLMASFYKHLFGDAQGYPVEAMYLSYVDYPYYRDQIYGQNYYGDPSIKIYLDTPSPVVIETPSVYTPGQSITGKLTLDGTPLPDQPLTVTIGEQFYETIISDGNGNFEITPPDECTDNIRLTVYIPGEISAAKVLTPSIVADADDDQPVVPTRFELSQNYPNPFNPQTTISFSLSRSGYASLKIYDILGRLIGRPADGYFEAGHHEVVWNGRDDSGKEVASGIYIYRLVSMEGTETRKMCLIR